AVPDRAISRQDTAGDAVHQPPDLLLQLPLAPLGRLPVLIGGFAPVPHRAAEALPVLGYDTEHAQLAPLAPAMRSLDPQVSHTSRVDSRYFGARPLATARALMLR